MRALAVSLAVCGTVAAAQELVLVRSSLLTQNSNKRTSQFVCPVANGVFCAGPSLETSTIIRCNGTIGIPSNCNDHLALKFPSGGSSSCWAVPGEDGFSACEKNGILYGDSGNIGGTYSLKTYAPSVTRSACPSTSTIYTVTTPTSSPAKVVYTTITTTITDCSTTLTTPVPSTSATLVPASSTSSTVTLLTTSASETQPTTVATTPATSATSTTPASSPPTTLSISAIGTGASNPANGNLPVTSGAPVVIDIVSTSPVAVPGTSEASPVAPAATNSPAAPPVGLTTSPLPNIVSEATPVTLAATESTAAPPAGPTTSSLPSFTGSGSARSINVFVMVLGLLAYIL